MSAKKVNLGDEVVCTVTKFSGIVTCISEYLNGCRRIGVQPPVGKDGKMPESWHIDEPQLKIVKAAKVEAYKPEAATTKPGGPASRSALK